MVSLHKRRQLKVFIVLMIIYCTLCKQTCGTTLYSVLGIDANKCNKFGLLEVQHEGSEHTVDCFMCAKKVESYSVLRKCCLNIDIYVEFCHQYLGGTIHTDIDI